MTPKYSLLHMNVSPPLKTNTTQPTIPPIVLLCHLFPFSYSQILESIIYLCVFHFLALLIFQFTQSDLTPLLKLLSLQVINHQLLLKPSDNNSFNLCLAWLMSDICSQNSPCRLPLWASHPLIFVFLGSVIYPLFSSHSVYSLTDNTDSTSPRNKE